LTISLSLLDKIEERKSFLASLKAKENDLNGLDENSLKEKVNFFLSALPGEKNFLKIVSTINKLAQNSQVVIENLQVSPGEVATEAAQLESPEVDRLTFQIEVGGNQRNVENFLSELEKTLPIFVIKTVKISSSNRVSQAQLVLENFFSKYPLSLGKISDPLAKPSEEDNKLYEVLKKMKSYPVESLDLTNVVPGSAKNDPFSSE
jgi:Tfp pilus assembly protein PilO